MAQHLQDRANQWALDVPLALSESIEGPFEHCKQKTPSVDLAIYSASTFQYLGRNLGRRSLVLKYSIDADTYAGSGLCLVLPENGKWAILIDTSQNLIRR